MALKFPCRYCPQAFRSKRSRGQHEKACKKGKKGKAYHWHSLTEADKAYIDAHAGTDNCSKIGRAIGFDQSTIYRYQHSKPAAVLPPAPEEPPIEEPEDIDPLKAQLLKGGPSNRYAPPARGGKNGFKVPDDFKADQAFARNAYVYHAPAREVGRIVSIDKNTVRVWLHDRIHDFAPEGALSMYNEMMARAKG